MYSNHTLSTGQKALLSTQLCSMMCTGRKRRNGYMNSQKGYKDDDNESMIKMKF